MIRGDLITVSSPGDYGKPRPALVIQADKFGHLDSVTVAPLTKTVLALPSARVMLEPTAQNGLRDVSFVMTDKIGTVRKTKTGPVIGKIDAVSLMAVDRALAVFFGLG